MVRRRAALPSVNDVSIFLLEAYVPQGTTPTGPGRLEVVAAAEQISDEGRPVRLVRTVQVPVDETCFYVFEASSVTAVIEAARRCGLQFERVVPAISA